MHGDRLLGYLRIVGECRKLGIAVSATSVRTILRSHGPGPFRRSRGRLECREAAGGRRSKTSASLPGCWSPLDTNRARQALQGHYSPLILSASTFDLRAEVLRAGPPGLGACLRCGGGVTVLLLATRTGSLRPGR